jgi:hypothetical protein
MFEVKKYSQILLPQQVQILICTGIVFLFISIPRLPAMDNNGRGVKAIGMANAFAAVSDNCWAIGYNPAGLTKVRDAQCAAFLIPEQFGLQELKTTAFAMAIPFSCASVGIQVVKFGFDFYSETEIGLAYAQRVDKNISCGLTVHYLRVDIDRYGHAGAFNFNGGFMTQVSDGVEIGFSVHNLTAATLAATGERMPQLVNLGIGWSPLENFQISAEMEKDVRFPASIKIGLEKVVLSSVSFRAGMANNPDTYSFGIGIRCSILEFGYAGYSHPDLGWTHQIELSMHIS